MLRVHCNAWLIWEEKEKVGAIIPATVNNNIALLGVAIAINAADGQQKADYSCEAHSCPNLHKVGEIYMFGY